MEKRIVIDKRELLKEEYRNYSETLDKMNELEKIITFERRILQAIAKQRNEYQTINEGLSLGKKAIESKNVERAREALQYLSDFRKLQLEKRKNFSDYDILLKKRDEFYILKFKLLAFIEEQEKLTAQIVQPPK